ncbi:TPA: J517_1871 family lipoprotein [Vibrio cholerae]
MKQLSLLGILIALGGCASPVDDVLNNRFSQIQAQPVPVALVGTWVGSVGPYLVTMQFGEDGKGTYRYTYLGTPIVQQTKYSSGEVFVEDGTRILVIDAKAQAIRVKSPHGGDAFVLNRE